MLPHRRRAFRSSNDPSDYGAVVLKWWVEASKEVYANGASVSSFTDWSTSNVPATQANATKQPTFQTAAVNGLPALLANGTDHDMTLASMPLAGAAAVTAMFVAKANNDPGVGSPGAPLGKWGGAVNGNHFPWTDGNIYDGSFSTSRKSVGNPAANLAQWNQITVISQSGSYQYRINGSVVFSTASNSVSVSGTPIILRADTYYFSGMLATVRLWSGVLSGANLLAEEAKLKNRYGTP